MKNFILCCMLILSLACRAEGLPDIADSADASLSPQQEKKLGEEVMRQIRADPSYLDDPELTQYLDDLGQRLIVNSTMPGLNLNLFVIQDNTINAFALPGGFIGVNSGLILSAESESELASVLSHEIGHVTQRHYARMAGETKGSTMESLAALAVAILAARSNGQVSEAALAAAQANSIQSQIDVTRAHEEEADRVGLQVLEKSGFDPRAMQSFFVRLQKSTRLYENNAPVYLHDHPLTSQRIAAIENRLQNLPYRQVADSPDFWLLREKLLADQGDANDALDFFKTTLRQKKYENETAYRFGLVEVLMRLRKYDQAASELAKVAAVIGQNPIILTMQGKVLLAQGKVGDAMILYRHALDTYPDYNALIYDYCRALIDHGKADDALKLIETRLLKTPRDYHLFQLRAMSYAVLGKDLLQHQAQAEAYYLAGNIPAAIEQLKIAENAKDGDFYSHSMVEARLSQFKAMMPPAAKHRPKH
ncbi:MAG: M48 family metallopeptidase [Burkholderiales bacterium]|nr:M48 family metallopeptidase [Burkholderiales bacterium]